MVKAVPASSPEPDPDQRPKTARTRCRGRPLDSILEETAVSSIDLLSIDFEGAEWEVLAGFDIERYQPRLVLLEDKHYHPRKHRRLVRHGYVLCKRTNLNCWYVPRGAKLPPFPLSERLRL